MLKRNEEDQLSLALRPRGQPVSATEDATDGPATNGMVNGRKTISLSEIEPHYSREPTQHQRQISEAKQTDEKLDLVNLRFNFNFHL